MLVGTVAVLSLVAVGSAIASIMIRHAEQDAQAQADRAQDEARKEQQEADRARTAETQVKTQLDRINTEQHARELAEQQALAKDGEAQMSRDQLQVALRRAQEQQRIALQESKRAREAEARAEEEAKRAAAREEEERRKRVEQEQRGKDITKELPR
jgi:hypothetical protein